jgi:hypothetical protein
VAIVGAPCRRTSPGRSAFHPSETSPVVEIRGRPNQLQRSLMPAADRQESTRSTHSGWGLSKGGNGEKAAVGATGKMRDKRTFTGQRDC